MKQKNKLFIVLLISVQTLKPFGYAAVAKGVVGTGVLIWYVKKYNKAFNAQAELERAKQEQIDRLSNHISQQSLEIIRLKDDNKQWQEYGQRMLEYARSLELQTQEQKKMSL